MEDQGQCLLNQHGFRDMRQLVLASATRFAAKPATIDLYKPSQEALTTFGQLGEKIQALGAAFMALGLQRGDKVAVLGRNRSEWIITYLAAISCAYIIVPVDKDLTVAEKAEILRCARAKVLVYSEEFLAEVASLRASGCTPVSVFICMDPTEAERTFSLASIMEKGGQIRATGNRNFEQIDLDPTAPAILLFTSGTTGASKGVLLSQQNILANLHGISQAIAVHEDDSFLSILPLHHTYEATGGFLLPLSRGCTVGYCESLRRISAGLVAFRPSIVLTVPLLLEKIYRNLQLELRKAGAKRHLFRLLQQGTSLLKTLGIDLRRHLFRSLHARFGGRLRLFIVGGAAMDPLISAFFEKSGLLVLQGYGLTETSPVLTVNRESHCKHDSVGLPLSHVQIRIAAPNAEGIGEVEVQGPNIMLGYFENNAATKEVMTTDGWFKTGDLGFLDADGFLFLKGRSKNVIVLKSGKNIWPEALEALLNRSPFVKECMVYGTDEKEDDFLIAAEIVPDLEAIQLLCPLPDGALTPVQVEKLIDAEIKAINDSLPIYRRIRRHAIRVEELPKTTTHKVRRHLVKKS